MPQTERAQAPAADGERTVHILENGQPKPVKVRTGVSDGKLTEIVSGELHEGDLVIISVKAAAP
jgi:HlyD family secretion protein